MADSASATSAPKAPSQSGLLSGEALHHLSNYKYHSGSSTLFDRLLNHWWSWVVLRVPLWMAPNLITFLGLISLGLHTALCFWFSPDLRQPLPAWLPIAGALVQFFYQTMDAIDGKQARRTGSSSPLGQLFDHGCDAISSVFVILSLAASLQLGDHAYLAVLLLTSLTFPFFLAQWEEYHTSVMRTNVSGFGVTEGQLLSMLITASAAFLPHGFFNRSISIHADLRELHPSAVFDITAPLSAFLVFPSVGINVFVTLGYIGNVILEHKKLHAIPHLIPMVSITVAMLALTISDSNVVESHPVETIFTFGVLNAHLCNQMIVGAMTRSPFSTLQFATFPFIAFAISCVAGLPVPKDTFFIVASAVIFVSYARYAWNIISDICMHLKIECFRIPAPKAS